MEMRLCEEITVRAVKGFIDHIDFCADRACSHVYFIRLLKRRFAALPEPFRQFSLINWLHRDSLA